MDHAGHIIGCDIKHDELRGGAEWEEKGGRRGEEEWGVERGGGEGRRRWKEGKGREGGRWRVGGGDERGEGRAREGRRRREQERVEEEWQAESTQPHRAPRVRGNQLRVPVTIQVRGRHLALDLTHLHRPPRHGAAVRPQHVQESHARAHHHVGPATKLEQTVRERAAKPGKKQAGGCVECVQVYSYVSTLSGNEWLGQEEDAANVSEYSGTLRANSQRMTSTSTFNCILVY